MRNSIYQFISALFIIIFLAGCSNNDSSGLKDETVNGKLFIIGGGKRPPEMIKELIRLSGLDQGNYAIVLPMSSSEPDTSFFYAKKQFIEQGVSDVFNLNIEKGQALTDSQIDSVENAGLIYISGGVQTKFMDIVGGTALHKAILEAYQKGAVIAGTSAGAAVMSKKMLTGNEYKHPEYTGEFRTIEADNMEITEGLGLLEHAIIDQHFIWRMRMNRLITVAIENPEETCIGIDESTAIIVEGDSATVTGKYQVIVIKNNDSNYTSRNGLLGKQNMRLDVYLPGDGFCLVPGVSTKLN